MGSPENKGSFEPLSSTFTKLVVVFALLTAFSLTSWVFWRRGNDSDWPAKFGLMDVRGVPDFYVSGSEKFKKQIWLGLALVALKDPEDYSLMKGSYRRISEGPHSGFPDLDQKEIVCYINDITAFSSVVWCAGTLVHEAYHIKLYEEYKNAQRASATPITYDKVDIEKRVIALEMVALKKLGASQKEMDWAANQDGTHALLPWTNRNW
jgi:hypothetical protein